MFRPPECSSRVFRRARHRRRPVTGAYVVQLAEELLDGGLRRSAPPASPEADVVPHVASKKGVGEHERLDEIEFSTL